MEWEGEKRKKTIPNSQLEYNRTIKSVLFPEVLARWLKQRENSIWKASWKPIVGSLERQLDAEMKKVKQRKELENCKYVIRKLKKK